MGINKFPKEESLKKMRKKLSRTQGTFILPPDADAVDKAKYETCKQILIFMHSKGLSQRKLASIMKIPETRVSEIVHYRIHKFTLDKIISYYEILNPKVTIKVA